MVGVAASRPLLARRRCSSPIHEQQMMVPPRATKAWRTGARAVAMGARVPSGARFWAGASNMCLPARAASSSAAVVAVVEVSWKRVKKREMASLVLRYSPG